MKYKIYIVTLVLSMFISSCNNYDCGNIEEWITESPLALEDYLEVKEEILANQDFIEEFKYGRGELYLCLNDTSKYINYHLPKLKYWLKKWCGFILIRENGFEEIGFKECYNWNKGTVSATLYHGEWIGKYNSQVVLIDSLSLKDGWYVHVVSCKDCDD